MAISGERRERLAFARLAAAPQVSFTVFVAAATRVSPSGRGHVRPVLLPGESSTGLLALVLLTRAIRRRKRGAGDAAA